MKFVLYDITLSGHHGSYLSAISKAAVRKGWQVSVVVPKSEAQHPQMSVLRETVGGGNVFLSDNSVKTPVPQSRLGLFRYHMAQREAALESLKPFRGKCDFVYTSTVDYMDKAIQVFGAPSYPTPFGGTRMRARFHLKATGVRGHKSTVGSLLEALSFRSLLRAKGVSCVTTADRSFADFCEAQPARTYRKVKYIPEIGMDRPSIGREEARAQLGFDSQDRVILVYGVISKRKALVELLTAIDTLGPGSPIKVLVVGRTDESTRLALESRTEDIQSGRLKMLLHFADADLENTVFAAADAVWIAYKGHSTMSGVFYQAACCGLPVIAPDYGILNLLTAQHGAGISVDPDNPEETGRQLQELLCDGDNREGLSQNLANIAELHFPENFGRSVCDAILEAAAA